jgi:hypothetical protein
VSTSAARNLSTHPILSEAIGEVLKGADIRAENVYIMDAKARSQIVAGISTGG